MAARLTKSDVMFLQRVAKNSGLFSGPIDGVMSNALADAEEKMLAEYRAIREEMGELDSRTEKNIASMLPRTQRKAREFMKAAKGFPVTVKIISGTRTYAEQDALFAIGRTIQLSRRKVTNAKGGQSNHNFGIAWDVGLFGADGEYLDGDTREEEKLYAKLGALIKDKVDGLEWGGDWESFVDMPHYQLDVGVTKTADVRDKFESGTLFA
jgi:peptidoglycan LD-endopeptidase CwlK